MVTILKKKYIYIYIYVSYNNLTLWSALLKTETSFSPARRSASEVDLLKSHHILQVLGVLEPWWCQFC